MEFFQKEEDQYFIYIQGFWKGFVEKENGIHIEFFEEVLKKTKLKNFKITENFEEANVLLDSIFDIFLTHKKDWKYKLHFSGESTTRNIKHFFKINPSDYDVVINSPNLKIKNLIDVPLFVPYIHCNKLLDKLTFNKPIVKEIPQKFCCFIVTNDECETRNKMFDLVNKYKKVDSYGKYMNNTNFIHVNNNYWSEEHIELIRQHKFHICFENVKEKNSNYITEKIINSFLGNAIPIYWGSNYSKQVFNDKAFLNLENETEDSFEKLLKEIMRIDSDDSAYLQMVNEPVFKDGFNFNDNYSYEKIAESFNLILSKSDNFKKCSEKGLKLINSPLFYTPNKDTYPPFKKGLYLEEYFCNYMKKRNIQYTKSGRLYIPSLWTNFQIENWFWGKREEMHYIIFDYYYSNYNENGYFAVVQHDDGPQLGLPENSVVCGACTGDIPLPLIYEDTDNKLENLWKKKSFNEKIILCSFVGTPTHSVRNEVISKFSNNSNFSIVTNSNWTPEVDKNKQYTFIVNTLNSKFALAPRGYGRSSFRFFEIFKLGTIPIYVWDDKEWLPYKEKLDYSLFCISIHVSELDTLEKKLLDIDEKKYNIMIEEYNKVKHMFELEYMCEYIIENI